jgi:hypothetical protein
MLFEGKLLDNELEINEIMSVKNYKAFENDE